jgi:hypothetical protein
MDVLRLFAWRRIFSAVSEDFIFTPKQISKPQIPKENIMKIRILFSAIIATFISSAALHATDWWSASAPSGNWDYTTITSWSYGNSPFQAGDTVAFPSYGPSYATTVNIDTSSVTAGNVYFSGTDSYTITGGTLAISGSAGTYPVLQNNTANTQTISSYVDATGCVTGLWVYGNTGGGTTNFAGGGAFNTIQSNTIGANLAFSAGTYNLSGNFNVSNNSTISITIGTGAMLNVSGIFNLTTWNYTTNVPDPNNDTLNLVASGLSPGDYVFASGNFFNNVTFANVTLNGGALPSNYSIDYTYGTGNQIALQVASVPEPSTWAMLLGGLGMLTMFRRRRA